jgi:hypothetical protein
MNVYIYVSLKFKLCKHTISQSGSQINYVLCGQDEKEENILK